MLDLTGVMATFQNTILNALGQVMPVALALLGVFLGIAVVLRIIKMVLR